MRYAGRKQSIVLLLTVRTATCLLGTDKTTHLKYVPFCVRWKRLSDGNVKHQKFKNRSKHVKGNIYFSGWSCWWLRDVLQRADCPHRERAESFLLKVRQIISVSYNPT